MSGKLTTHVLDTASGKPASGLSLELYRLSESGSSLVSSHRLNEDGRVDGPLLEGKAFQTGYYELHFYVADYFREQDVALPDFPFLDVVPVRFAINDQTHYHVPLLVSPYGYSTYRGS